MSSGLGRRGRTDLPRGFYLRKDYREGVFNPLGSKETTLEWTLTRDLG